MAKTQSGPDLRTCAFAAPRREGRLSASVNFLNFVNFRRRAYGRGSRRYGRPGTLAGPQLDAMMDPDGGR